MSVCSFVFLFLRRALQLAIYRNAISHLVSSYGTSWDRLVNTGKTKKMVFDTSRKTQKTFHFGDTVLEVVEF